MCVALTSKCCVADAVVLHATNKSLATVVSARPVRRLHANNVPLCLRMRVRLEVNAFTALPDGCVFA